MKIGDSMLYKLEHFFQVDIEIKKGIYNLVPTNLQYGYEAGIEKYTNDLDDFLSYAYIELKCIAMDVLEKIQMLCHKFYPWRKELRNNSIHVDLMLIN